MTKKQIKVTETRYPKLTRAVLRSVDREQLIDVCYHGASAGFGQFVYYKDTLAFYRKNKGDIMALAKEQAEDFGIDVLKMIKDFGCLKNIKLTPYEIAEALHSHGDDNIEQVQNAMAWYALEEIARELNPDL